MFRYAVVDKSGNFVDFKGQDLFKTKEDAEKAAGKMKDVEVRPVPVGAPLIVPTPRKSPADEARKQAKLSGKKAEVAVKDEAEGDLKT